LTRPGQKSDNVIKTVFYKKIHVLRATCDVPKFAAKNAGAEYLTFKKSNLTPSINETAAQEYPEPPSRVFLWSWNPS
jgi:hypothetical protein